ncbi:hypothetical protein [Salinisphaera sp. LB1]|uniref:hypothetical protein n=1 Tax=Salinisphaera sp. LB1 TaxID=2183911 RepID=UPI000D7075FD|nr:hypothetical protein [Salinisphaera sp. LB1]AWN16349.1 hypothetical protein SALB1_2151 [Salinisphaera sp. LB1]
MSEPNDSASENQGVRSHALNARRAWPGAPARMVWADVGALARSGIVEHAGAEPACDAVHSALLLDIKVVLYLLLPGGAIRPGWYFRVPSARPKEG